MRRIAIILAAGALMAGDLGAEAAMNDRQRSAWPQEQESRPSRSLSEWLPSVLPFGSNDDASADDSEPVASEPAPPPRRQQPARRAAEPQPDPEPELTPEEQEAEDRWWEEIGDPAVAAFSRCLREHVIDETTRGSQSSYPDFVTTAMNSRCSREFAGMAQPILERHGEDNFARIARKLIATRFVPAVKQVVEGGPSEEIAPVDDRPALEAAMRQSKEAMFGCLVAEADRLAASSAAPADRLADRVIAACQASAEAYVGTLEQLYPAAAGGNPSQTSATILDTSYRPAIVQRIDSLRDGAGVRVGGGKADTQAVDRTGPETVSPAGETAPGSPAPANSRP